MDDFEILTEEEKKAQREAYENLTDMQKKFVNAYVSDNSDTRFNGKQSAKKAGYSFPTQQAWELKEKPHVQRAIKFRMRNQIISEGELLLELRNMIKNLPDEERNKMQAIKLLAKQYRRFSDKKDVKQDVNVSSSEEELDKLLGFDKGDDDDEGKE